MGIITINAEPGSKGILIAQKIAEKLGYLYFDHIIAEEIAELLRIHKIDVKSFEEERHENIVATISKYFSLDIFKKKKEKNEEIKEEKLYSRNIRDSYKHLLPYKLDAKGWIDSHVYKKMLYKVITALAKTDNCVIVGRGANVILKDEPDSLHLRFVANKEYRRKTLVEIKGVPENEVDKLLETLDKKAISYNKYYFEFDVNDPHYYSAILNVAQLGEENIVNWVTKYF
jgi:cytidylate kinase